MKQGENANWSFNPEQFADLASSLSNFFNQTGGSPHSRTPGASQFDLNTGNGILSSLNALQG